MRATYFYDDVNATLLALIAKAPQNNQHFIARLTGDAQKVGKAILHLSSGSMNVAEMVPDLAIRMEARSMLEWAERIRSKRKLVEMRATYKIVLIDIDGSNFSDNVKAYSFEDALFRIRAKYQGYGIQSIEVV